MCVCVLELLKNILSTKSRVWHLNVSDSDALVLGYFFVITPRPTLIGRVC